MLGMGRRVTDILMIGMSGFGQALSGFELMLVTEREKEPLGKVIDSKEGFLQCSPPFLE